MPGTISPKYPQGIFVDAGSEELGELLVIERFKESLSYTHMGRMKELWMERMEEDRDDRLARKLGITRLELEKLNYKIDTEESTEGVVYSYIISFAENAPREILNKVVGLDKNDCVWISPWEIDDDEYYAVQLDVITSNTQYYQSFLQSIASIKKLNELEPEGHNLADVLKRQLYVSVITA